MDTIRKPSWISFLAVLALAGILLAACTPASPTQTLPDTGAIYTQAVQTISAQQTLTAGQNAVAQLTQQAVQPSPTSQVVLPSESQQPTVTPVGPSPTPLPPSPTAAPATSTPIPQPCDWAQFIRDVTVKDGTIYSPGQEFTKTWRLKNIGTCNWTVDYDLVFASGDRMEASKTITLDGKVKPGQSLDISAVLTAPAQPGDYTGRWMLRNADGKLFGIGDKQDKPFWVRIKVVRPNKLAWDLAKDACLANWSTGALNGLACPDLSENTQTGFINLHSKPRLETGSTDNEPALAVHPDQSKNGFIQGVFPAYKVKEGDHFRAVIGCLYGSKECKVTFQLSYRGPNGRVKTLDTWNEKYDEKLQKIDIDLSELAGKEIELILTVFNRDDSTGDRVFWLRPSIWR